MTHRILCTIGKEFAPEARKILETLGNVDFTTTTQAQLAVNIGKYDAVVTQLGLQFNANILGGASKLRFIATATTGTDHIDLAAAKKHSIAVLSLKSAKALLKDIPSTAEHTWGLLLALIRNIVPAADAVADGQWNGRPFAGMELHGKTLGIIGVGRLGRMVAEFGKAFGMKVLGSDLEKIPPSICTQKPLNSLLKISDIVSLHVHLTPKTKGMIGKKELQRMKSTAVLINTARGKLVDERALLAALKTKSIAGYAADVLAGETLFHEKCGGDPLVRYAKTHSNVLLTPHIGGRTIEARKKTDIFIAEKLRLAMRAGTNSA